MNRKSIFYIILSLLSCTGLYAQKGLHIGPAVSGGLLYSNNFILDDTSQYFIGTSPGLTASGGLDVLFGFDENISVSVGGQYRFRQFTLGAPAGQEGLSFSEIQRNVTNISIPMMVHYRVPLGESEKTWLKFSLGHSIDIHRQDSSVTRTPATGVIDSGSTFIRHELHNLKRTFPSVLLGVGADFEFDNGSVLNLGLIWGIGTGKIFEGNLKEWFVVNRDYDLDQLDEPEEFPEVYYDFALRGSYLSLRISYLFSLDGLFGGGDEE